MIIDNYFVRMHLSRARRKAIDSFARQFLFHKANAILGNWGHINRCLPDLGYAFGFTYGAYKSCGNFRFGYEFLQMNAFFQMFGDKWSELWGICGSEHSQDTQFRKGVEKSILGVHYRFATFKGFTAELSLINAAQFRFEALPSEQELESLQTLFLSVRQWLDPALALGKVQLTAGRPVELDDWSKGYFIGFFEGLATHVLGFDEYDQRKIEYVLAPMAWTYFKKSHVRLANEVGLPDGGRKDVGDGRSVGKDDATNFGNRKLSRLTPHLLGLRG